MPLYIAKSGDLDRCYRCLTDWLTTLKDSATQLPIKYKSGALVTQYTTFTLISQFANRYICVNWRYMHQLAQSVLMGLKMLLRQSWDYAPAGCTRKVPEGEQFFIPRELKNRTNRWLITLPMGSLLPSRANATEEINLTCEDPFQIISNRSLWWWKQQITGGQGFMLHAPIWNYWKGFHACHLDFYQEIIIGTTCIPRIMRIMHHLRLIDLVGTQILLRQSLTWLRFYSTNLSENLPRQDRHFPGNLCRAAFAIHAMLKFGFPFLCFKKTSSVMMFFTRVMGSRHETNWD